MNCHLSIVRGDEFFVAVLLGMRVIVGAAIFLLRCPSLSSA